MITSIGDTAEAVALRNSLVDDLARRQVLTSRAWQDAFRAVPRHLFTTRFTLAGDSDSDGYDLANSTPSKRTAALALVYSDRTLITRVDTTGRPTSSSTQPGLMATMLQHLHAHPGQRVLEIGTGTGYNTALLCHVLDSHAVTTIDVDPDLTATATTALAAAGYHPTIVCGDGALGVPDHAPYDRIIATCSVDRVPPAWPRQLAVDGAILANISTGIIRLRQHADRTLAGRFLAPAGFMPLRPITTSDTAPTATALGGREVIAQTSTAPDITYPATVPDHLDYSTATFFTSLVAASSSLVFLHHHDGDQVRSYRWLHPATGSWARIELLTDNQAMINETGPRHLWRELAPVLDHWHTAGRPTLDRYGLTVTTTGTHRLWLDQPRHHVTTLPANEPS